MAAAAMDPRSCCKTLVTLLRRGSPQLLTADDPPDSNSTSQTQIVLSAEFKRIYQTPPESPAQMAAESHGARFLIPADSKDSIRRTVSQLNIPLHPEPHRIRWNSTSASWIPVQSREGLISRIAESLWQIAESESESGKRVVVEAKLKITELRRVSEKEYVRIWRETRMGVITNWVKRMLIRRQKGNRRVMSVDEVRIRTEEFVRTVDGKGNVGLVNKLLDSGTIDLIASRAFEGSKRVLGLAIDNALVVVKQKEGEGGGGGRECSICLGPILMAEYCAVVRLPKCGHCFHRQCVTPWLVKAPTCPLCRSCPLPSTFGTAGRPSSATLMTCVGVQLGGL